MWVLLICLPLFGPCALINFPSNSFCKAYEVLGNLKVARLGGTTKILFCFWHMCGKEDQPVAVLLLLWLFRSQLN